MPAGPSRRVRLARTAEGRPAAPGGPPPDPAREVPGTPLRRNRCAQQRVRRLTVGFVAVLAALYLGLSLAARAGPQGASAGTFHDLELFGLVAFATAIAGALLTLLSAPASVDVGPHGTVVRSVLGTRSVFRSGPEYALRIVREYRPGVLADGRVASVEVRDGRRRRTYLIDAGLLPREARRVP